MSKNRKELKKIISEMSLEEKALQLTQFPSYELDDNQEKIVTGFSHLGSVERESLWRIGTILNAPNAEAVQSIRKKRKEKGIDDPLPIMLDVSTVTERFIPCLSLCLAVSTPRLSRIVRSLPQPKRNTTV